MSVPTPLVSHQKLRPEETRQRLVDSAIEVLIGNGYQNFSFVKVCAQAGLSRGAIHHHFKTPNMLVADLIAEIFARLKSNITQDPDFTRLSPDRADDVIDVLWAHLKTDLFRILLEIRAAAASDPSLAASIIDLNEEMNREMIAYAITHHGASGASIRIIFAALSGMALQYFTLTARPRDADQYAAEFITALKDVINA